MYDNLQTYLYIAVLLFAIGMYGVLARRSFIAVLISVELMLNAAGINFMAFNRFLAPDPAVGQIFTLFIMAVAAAEAAIALSIIVAVYRKLKSINAENVNELRG
ncbi:NADH-quinone oxidoreductase subunit NuoK [Desulfobacca acetoxidans]|uniref:NADH-quinone oxidoreductase subunit K n=1 Tax=Desulfobacca acetoxidans (strain ATCC 700848 / DSM 11109 / ASRB2) TaxID=880072 RepID=F2NHF2_DESAR|nr:NADH-quinone oxidoreductase subunit NuoK [Desulfobacca acetoxidans]AEB09068.1 NAD(P)H-quinone oxidoreductase subunit 4L [Desulfobacca acetoxidans DSM 11109]HAY22067.1 NADH-quinone oxidoreductase subunit NuoK [Desulfobacterales bacterium]